MEANRVFSSCAVSSVTVLGRRFSHGDGLICQLDVEGVYVGGGVDGNGGYAEFLTGADDTAGYLAPVGD